MNLDDLPSLASYQEYAAYAEKVHGWDADTVKDKLLILVEEVGELAKAVRVDRDAADKRDRDPGKEIADAFNVLLTIANRLGVDVGEAFAAKHRGNAGRLWARHTEGSSR